MAEHGENGIGLLGDLTGERFRQQQDAAAQQESQNTARQQGGTPDAAHLFHRWRAAARETVWDTAAERPVTERAYTGSSSP